MQNGSSSTLWISSDGIVRTPTVVGTMPCAAQTDSTPPIRWAPETPIDEALQKFAEWVTDYYADRPVLEV